MMKSLYTLLLLPTIVGGASVSELDDAILPDHVTICDGSSPVGLIQAYLLTEPLKYCMNDGVCKDDYESQMEPCECPSGFEGPHCEFIAGTMPECTMKCFAGGICQTGAKSFELLQNNWTAPEDFQYCLCPDEFQGDQCERQVETCDGNNHCLHGGTCTSITSLDGQVSKYCDCTTAEDGAYAGKYCDHKATVFCAEDDPNGHAFCTNGGTCKGGSELGCDCPDGFIGPVCEFKSEQRAYSECKLECFNGGICRKGAKDISYLEKFGFHRHLAVERFNEDFEHCVCPNGLVGLQCEYQMDVCPGREVVCMHGGVCQITTDTTKDGFTAMSCDCSTAEKEYFRYTGEYCEVKSTEFCTLDGHKTMRGENSDAFCTQGGQCRDYVTNGDQHPGCHCPDGTSGDHCEIGNPTVIKQNSNRKRLLGLLLSLGLILVVILVIVVRHRRKGGLALYHPHRRNRGNIEPFKDCPPPPTMDHINNMENSWMRSSRTNRSHHSGNEVEGHFLDDQASVSSLGLSESMSNQFGGSVNEAEMSVHASVRDQAAFSKSQNGNVILMKPKATSSNTSSGYIAPANDII
ncbi:hypothetical protein MPSEU_000705400 [Mayamaea pseudoterrestris]|nr:hypothetical protein MPSEU_000705400 [Mayamaea pseudoterrestris]